MHVGAPREEGFSSWSMLGSTPLETLDWSDTERALSLCPYPFMMLGRRVVLCLTMAVVVSAAPSRRRSRRRDSEDPLQKYFNASTILKRARQAIESWITEKN